MTKPTPMLQQYFDIKNEYKDCILFFRLGDFYEMFGDDAKIASQALDIVLTSREAGKDRRIPMCGVPYHASTSYIARLVRQGYRVAVCEQMEDPSKAKGLVKRQVIRVVTPGTVIDEDMLDTFENNYIAAVCVGSDAIGLSWMDITTGEFYTSQVTDESELHNEIFRIQPSEILIEDSSETNFIRGTLAQEVPNAVLTKLDPSNFDSGACFQRLCEHFGTADLSQFGCADLPRAVQAAGALLAYVSDMERTNLQHVNSMVTRSLSQYMSLDKVARKNLELTASLSDGQRKGTLLSVIDKTETAMGGRTLRQWLEQPLMSVEHISRRLDAVDELARDLFLREGLAESMKGIQDLERICGRIVMRTATPRDLVSLKWSLSKLGGVKDNLSRCESGLLTELCDRIDLLEDLVGLISQAIVDDPPASLREGGVIREGYSSELDELRELRDSGKRWIAQLEQTERARTGIKSLRVGYNQVFGYYIEVTRANLNLVPDDYIRKQTLANAERFITPSLKEREERILSAEERSLELEVSLFSELLDKTSACSDRIKSTAEALGCLDSIVSLARVAVERDYRRPEIHSGLGLHVIGARHPVVETMGIEGGFVPNDTKMDPDSDQILIITGPNMSGKSTYLRQVALITIMAQMGSFVPAESASIGVVDRIFTRIGASDDLASGKSTFMVEMSEVSVILNHASTRSLIILDEVGRGTSTYDGIAIAWAVVEYLHEKRGMTPKTLFATHYHELTDLESMYKRVKNYRVDVSEEGDRVVFLRRIVEGGADKSYGIEVARLAGLPRSVIARARQIQSAIESRSQRRVVDSAAIAHSSASRSPARSTAGGVAAPSLFDAAVNSLVDDLAAVDCNSMTPLQALSVLHSLAERAREEVRLCRNA